MSNLDTYNKLKTPPKEALKPIKAGRLKGKTDISPQWRIEALTEVFGICGIGWKFEIAKQWTEPADAGQMFAFVNVNLYVSVDDKWSAPIPGTGGTLLIVNESSKVYSNDEAYKMSLTDALGMAMKCLGVAADVYMGKLDSNVNNDSSKYQSNRQVPESKYKFGDSKNESLPWVNDTNIKGMIESINNGEKNKVTSALPKYRWSNANKDKIIKELDEKK